jgi:DNA-binding response OmpR family regulator
VTYLFLEASTAEIGLALCHQHRPDCILLDYNLPDLSGDELLQIVIESAELPAYPVMMLTGKGNERLAVRSLLGGAQDYIVKDGLTPEALIRALGNAVQKVRNERSG